MVVRVAKHTNWFAYREGPPLHDPLSIHDLVHDELDQARETGHDVGACERALVTLDPTDVPGFEGLYRSILDSPRLPGWSYEEPDLIGDIHGCAKTLEHLLATLGYRREAGVWRHPQRMAIFLGDLVDRGPRIREALHLVRDMVAAGQAHCIMGNHEFNALGWSTPAAPGSGRTFVREHTPRHARLIKDTLQQFEAFLICSVKPWAACLGLGCHKAVRKATIQSLGRLASVVPAVHTTLPCCPTRRSTGPTTACHLRASFHSGPPASCRRGPVSFNVGPHRER